MHGQVHLLHIMNALKSVLFTMLILLNVLTLNKHSYGYYKQLCTAKCISNAL